MSNMRLSTRRLAIGGGLASAALAGAARSATAQAPAAQAWPSRHVTVVVPFPAGGPTDVIARAMAGDLAEKLGAQFVVENRSGAAGNVGSASVAKAAPDGYTLLFATTSVVNNRFLYRSVTFDSDRDFAPVVLISKVPLVIIVHPDMPAKTLADLIAQAKANPGKLSVGTPGHGTVVHITSELLQQRGQFKLNNVPYRGSSPMFADLLGRQIDVMIDLIPTSIPLLKEGRIRGLAVTSAARSRAVPDIPTLHESGFAGLEATSWNALLAPAGTPPEIIGRLNALINAYLTSEKGKQDLAKFDMEAGGGTPNDLRAFMAAEAAKWGPIIKAANITVD
jgi:tripartite-type tricarboxylate transporter receptor subunit TctC